MHQPLVWKSASVGCRFDGCRLTPRATTSRGVRRAPLAAVDGGELTLPLLDFIIRFTVVVSDVIQWASVPAVDWSQGFRSPQCSSEFAPSTNAKGPVHVIKVASYELVPGDVEGDDDDDNVAITDNGKTS